MRECRADRGPRPVVDAGAVRPVAAGQPLPGTRPDGGDHVLDRAESVQTGGHLIVVVGGHHVGDVLFLQPVTQTGVLPERLVDGEPGERHARSDRPLDHRFSLLRCGREPHVLGHRGLTHRSGSWVQDFGRYNSRSINARPRGEA